jgi:hypothetical protein
MIAHVHEKKEDAVEGLTGFYEIDVEIDGSTQIETLTVNKASFDAVDEGSDYNVVWSLGSPATPAAKA